MIYSGLEFGQYFELVRNVNCSSVLMAVTPAVRMAFVIIQLQFIFMSDKVVIIAIIITVFCCFLLNTFNIPSSLKYPISLNKYVTLIN